ncbi:MAG: D-2-hydroxyacid dehydrogenase [Planctomycetota bacterium]|nr:D-2-hydroxyacid dehydrogenase [Planctomycetota bacterium]MDA1179877.1 D-2-hydroxyacid dehydrogenase [Planctomycetota bacterium]
MTLRPSISASTVPRITILDGVTLNPGDNPWDELGKLGKVTIHDRTPASEVIARSTDADVLVINKVRLASQTLAQLPDLKLVTVTATGYDCVDSAAAKELGITVCNVPEYGTDSVAQHAFALLLHLCHHVEQHDRAVRAGKWQQCGDFSFWERPLIALAGKTLGIVGWGRIGRQMAEIGRAFGMQIQSYTRTRKDPPTFREFAWAESLQDLVSQSDVVTLHCPLTDATRGMINADVLQHFRRDSFLLNTSRGALVVEQDLADALRDGKLLAAAVDVVSQEPITDNNPLLTAPHCVITPHQAWATLLARQRLMQTTVENVRAFLAGNPIHTV